MHFKNCRFILKNLGFFDPVTDFQEELRKMVSVDEEDFTAWKYLKSKNKKKTSYK